MGDQPLAEDYGGNALYPLRLVECCQCHLIQLDWIVDQSLIFRPDHTYATGQTPELVAHFAEVGKQIAYYMHPGDLVVDIGANDGTLLASIPKTGIRRFAIEPTNQIKKALDRGIEFGSQTFFTADFARMIRKERGAASVVTATNVLAHVPDVHDFMEGVRELLAPGGVFITENHDVKQITEGMQIDTIYHEHRRYYSLESLSNLLERHGFRVAAFQNVSTHGGSFQVIARAAVLTLEEKASEAARDLYRIVANAGRPVWGIGATTRATPLIHYAKLAGLITAVAELPGSGKIGKTIPGTNIPIVSQERMLAEDPPAAVNFLWYLGARPVMRLREAGWKGTVINPLPEPEIVRE